MVARFTDLRVPLIIDIEADPFERAWEDSELYRQWQVEHVFLLVPAQAFAAKFLATFKEFPQRQKVASFNLDKVVRQMLSTSQNERRLPRTTAQPCFATIERALRSRYAARPNSSPPLG